MSFHAKPGCLNHLINIYEKAVNALPSSYLLPPVTGEVFVSIEACKQRLCGFTLAEGFDIVRIGGGSKHFQAIVGSVSIIGKKHEISASLKIISKLMKRKL